MQQPVIRRTALPSELCDRTIDFLWDDHSALAACALTCHSWLPRSRYHLFFTVKLETRDDWARFDRCLTRNASLEALGGIAPYVRRLLIGTRSHRTFRDLDSNLWSLPTKLGLPRFSRVLAPLSRVESLAMGDPDLYVGASEALAEEGFNQWLRCLRAAPFASTLRDLTLSFLIFEHVNDAMQLLAVFPALCNLTQSHLAVLHTFADAPTPVHPLGPERSIFLQHISVRVPMEKALSASWAPLAVWLAGPPFVLRTRQLSWRGSPIVHGQPLLSNILEKAAQSLKDVRLALAHDDPNR
ncbi:hypothetical protein B0H21DRAFT_87890 [Amylocystis lapponica]|nr:hypothetical protein B0H21DRAFT_87890 [Amylocystis lapponica]